jgi:aminoglycoside 6-adenylyltransferase
MNESRMLQRFIDWGMARGDVRALILTSTRTAPGSALDVFSDYDLIIVTTDPAPYQPDAWLSEFGPLLVVYRDPVRLIHGEPSFARITQYENGLKIDFTIWTAELARRFTAAAAQSGRLEPDYDLGYRILLDKDGLTAGLPAPTHKAYIPTPPDYAEYYRLVESIFHESTYAAKYLWRDDLMAAKFMLDEMIKGDNLRPMLEYYMQIGKGWTVRAGAHGRGLKRKLPPEIWAEFEQTYVGPGLAENWTALFATLALFEKVARAVGAHLGYAYPQALHERCMIYLRRVQALPPGATAFPWAEE